MIGLPATKPRFVLTLSGKPESLKGKISYADKSADLKKPKLDGEHFTATFDSSIFGENETGIGRLSAVMLPTDDGRLVMTGSMVLPSGGGHVFSANWSESAEETKEDQQPGSEEGEPAESESGVKAGQQSDTSETDKAETNVKDSSEQDRAESTGGKADKEDDQVEPVVASFEVNYPLGAFGVSAITQTPSVVAFVNATVWTSGEARTLENATVLAREGIIAAVGADVEIPDDAVVIDCSGKHLSPGIIDCHSHMATDGGVNEGSQAVTAEVRIGDFIDANDISIYRQLAGGVTTANVLHGSANPIGGQNQVIKLALGDELERAEVCGGSCRH